MSEPPTSASEHQRSLSAALYLFRDMRFRDIVRPMFAHMLDQGIPKVDPKAGNEWTSVMVMDGPNAGKTG